MSEKVGKFINRGKLMQREGWNGPAVNRLLGEPDELMPAKDGSDREVKRYLVSRVEEIEKSGRLAKFNVNRAKRLAEKAQAEA